MQIVLPWLLTICIIQMARPALQIIGREDGEESICIFSTKGPVFFLWYNAEF
jgi:hypothetical protein